MHIQKLSLHTRQIAEQKAFYCNILNLPLLTETTDAFTVQAGTTSLHFQETPEQTLYHIAFTVPRQSFYEVKNLMQKRVPLLTRQGKTEIFFTNLNARSFYFCDVVGNILEYIVHYNLTDETERASNTQRVLHISEIGLPVENVPAFAELLDNQLSIVPYGGSISEDFAFLGDIFGQLVVVKVGRPWLPTETVPATIAPVQLTIRGQQAQQRQLLPYPYTITTIPLLRRL